MLLLSAGCGLAKSGTASVSAQFDLPECQPNNEHDSLEDYSFNAGYMATERFAGTLLMMIQKHRVNVEETDALVVRMNLDDLLESGRLSIDSVNEQYVRPDPAVPLALDLTLDPEGTNASLSLFQTCPEFPTHQAIAGELIFTAIVISQDPEDTGRMEHLAGTLTATLTRSNAEGRVGTLQSAFDFAPPRQPLTDFK